LIAILLLKWLHHLSQANWSLSNLATMLRLNLFTYRDLRDWINPTSTLFPMILAKSGGQLAEVACFQRGFLETSEIVTNYFAYHLDSRGSGRYM